MHLLAAACCVPSEEKRRSLVLYLFAQGGDVSLKSGVHSVEGLCFAEIFTHVLWQLFLLLTNLCHQLLSIIKVPSKSSDS